MTSKELLNLEEKVLAPYAMKAKYSRGRKYPEEEYEYRTCYQRDRDRIIHSTAFRRMEYKTQVFVNHEGDYYRTRLTHTIEVAQIARTIARALRVNEDLTEAIALAHDIGHPPFGHAGEEALNELMPNGFEHNLQGLRVVDVLEYRYPDFHGLNLTFEVREGIVKHVTVYDKPDISQLKEFEPDKSPTIEAQIINLADEIAYNVHDIDDGLKSGYIELEQLEEVKIWKEIFDEVKKELKGKDIELCIRKTLRKLISAQIEDVINTTLRNIEKHNVDSVEKVRELPPLVEFSKDMAEYQNELKKFLYENLYTHYKVVKMQNKAKRYVKALFTTYLSDMRQIPPDFKKRCGDAPPEQIVCDYIAGMTDRFAQDEYERLFLPYAKM